MPWDEESDRKIYAERTNKSAVKRHIKQVEVLANQLVELSADRLANAPLSDEIRQEIDVARSTRGHGSRKRQMKHLTAVLRRDDETLERLQGYVDGTGNEHHRQVAAFHDLEQLRDRLCTFDTMDAALAEVKASYPHADARQIEKLAKRAWAGKDRTAYRKVFRLLKQAADFGFEPS